MLSLLNIQLFIICCLLNKVLTIENYPYDENFGKTWMYFPDGEGIPHIIYLIDKPDITTTIDSVSPRHFPSKDKIQFELYTRNNYREAKVISTGSNSRGNLNDFYYYFQSECSTIFIIHGWKSSGNSSYVQNIKNAYLKQDDYNIIVCDWSEIAGDIYYFSTVKQIRDVGQIIAELIDYLCDEFDANPNHIHIIGHSLGAHAAGYAGSFTRQRLGRITGLDPALPGFEMAGPETSLDKTDAKFVDVIHTCGGVLGLNRPLGHIDFYPNKGTIIQPGCTSYTELSNACSHGRSHQFYVESITTHQHKGFIASSCNSWEQFEANNCSSNKIFMGELTPSYARGIYYLRTKDSSPFAYGK